MTGIILSRSEPVTGFSKPNRAVARLFRNPGAIFGAIVLVLLVVLVVAGPAIYPVDPQRIVGPVLIWPGQDGAFPLGTDALGRDILAQLIHGAQLSLSVGFAATLLSLVVGVLVGAIAGYLGGWPDSLLVRIIEIFQTLPDFVLVVVLVAILDPSATTVIIAIAIIRWPTIARLTRAEFRALRQTEFVQAAETVGHGPVWVMVREILPNALPSLIVLSSIMVASAILLESALAFMGLGDPNLVSWGTMVGSGRDFIRTQWYLTAIPGAAIVITVLAVNFLGDALNDALNPRLSGARTLRVN